MFGTIELNGRQVELSANAATAFRMKQIFDVDLMKVFMNVESDGGAETAAILPQLTYVMNCQAKKEDMNKLNFETFLLWCEDFDAFEITSKAQDIIDLYLGNMKTTSTSKKK